MMGSEEIQFWFLWSEFLPLLTVSDPCFVVVCDNDDVT